MSRAAWFVVLVLAVSACKRHPRPRGEVTELGAVGKIKELAVRGKYLYATAMRDEPVAGKPTMNGPIDLWFADRTGGQPRKLVADLPPGVTAYGDDTMYDAGVDGTITAVDLESGERRTLAELHTYLYAIAVTADLVIVSAEHDRVIRVSRKDGSQLATPPAGVETIDRLVTDGTRVVGASIASGAVFALDDAGAATRVADPQNRPTCLGLTPTHTFWARDVDGHKSELVGVARGGTVVDRLADLASSFPACTSFGDRIYIADERQLLTLVPGAAATKLATTGWIPALTATENGVYWAQMIASGWQIRFNAVP
jgi:hypothetical protein